MKLNVAKEVAALNRLTTNDLRSRYAEVFGERTHANNKPWLVKRIAWRLQALAEGDLTERARQRARELANDADLRLSPPKVKTLPMTEVQTAKATTAGVPVPGTRGRLEDRPGAGGDRAAGRPRRHHDAV